MTTIPADPPMMNDDDDDSDNDSDNKETLKPIHHGESILTTATQESSSDDDDSASAIVPPPSTKQKSSSSSKRQWNSIPYTTILPFLVMMDMLGVALVVSLSSRYFQLAGVTSAVQREWLASIFSASQIVGGLTIGALADSHVLSRKFILLMSFCGSAFAYAMILQGGLVAMVISRVTVGLVKQTMTVTSVMIAHSTHERERATHVGRLNASATGAWIVGPSLGAYLFSHVGTYAPIYVSCSLFILNVIVVVLFLPSDDEEGVEEEETTTKRQQEQQPQQQSAVQRIVSNFQACFYDSSNKCLAASISAMLLFQWVLKTTSYKYIASFYETHYGIESHQRGYLQSYQSALMFLVQSMGVKPILQALGGEVNAACTAAAVMAAITLAETQMNFTYYLIVVCPILATATAILGVTLKSIVSKVAPKQSLGSVFATIDVLTNAAQVTVPFYRTLLFSFTQPKDSNDTGGDGDPDPVQWLLASGIHWMLAAVAFGYLLVKENPCANLKMAEYNNNGSNKHTAASNKDLQKFIETENASHQVVIWSKSFCPYCTITKELFNSIEKVIVVHELDKMENGRELQNELFQVTGQKTVPNVFVNNKHIGGNEDVQRMYKEGTLFHEDATTKTPDNNNKIKTS